MADVRVHAQDFSIFQRNTCISSLYAPSAPACLSVTLPVSLFKHLGNIISVYCNSCLCMSYLHC